jgi:homoserine dehydrogenase
MNLKLALLGFGNVGRSFCRLLLEKKAYLKRRYDVTLTVVGVYDIQLGGIIADEVDIENLLETVESGGMIEDAPGASEDLNSLGLIEKSGADILVEMTYTDLETGQPAVSHCQQALASNINVVTSNKGPAALARKDLWSIAQDHGVHFRCEAAVMSGTPVISLANNSMAGGEITGFRGLLNGTTNYILSRMEEGATLDQASAEAKEKGFAEADISIDIDGWDSAAKCAILVNTIMEGDVSLKSVPRKGIGKLTPEEIENARENNKHWKLMVECSKDMETGEIKMQVAPQMVDNSDPLAAITGTDNALTLSTDVIGDVTIHGRGAGRLETAFSLLSDILWISRRMKGSSV